MPCRDERHADSRVGRGLSVAGGKMVLLVAYKQKAREFQKLKEIQAERAKERQATRNDIKENFPESNGQSRDLAAAKVGMSGKTAKKAAEVVNDSLEQTG